jgi:HAD superfamily hydrolase (TIGR01549 family)
MLNLQGFFLDFYGTVVGGDRAAVVSVCQRVLDDHGLVGVDAEAVAHAWGMRYFKAIESLIGRDFRLLSEIEFDTLVETVQPLAGPIDVTPYIDQFNAYLTQPILFEEVRDVLARVRLPVCVVSNADERELRNALNHLELCPDYVITSESARSYKPETRIFEKALEVTGWTAERVLHIGDSLHSDVGGARRAGLHAAWVSRADRISDIGTEQPDFTWTDLRPMLEF